MRLTSNNTTLQENKLHQVVFCGEGVVIKHAKTPKAQESLRREFRYRNDFHLPPENGIAQLPDMIPKGKTDHGFQSLKMPYYPGEALTHIRSILAAENDTALDIFLKKMLGFTTMLRTQYPHTEGKLKKQTGARLARYAIPFLKRSIRDSVGQLLDDSNEIRFSFQEFLICMDAVWESYSSFPFFDQEFRIHGCLNPSHILITENDVLVPIDFEHGANYPRRLKYQDEAYIFQNLIKQIPESDVAQKWLRKWLEYIGYDRNVDEKQHADMAIMEKLIGGISETLQQKPPGYESIVRKHIELILHYRHRRNFLSL